MFYFTPAPVLVLCYLPGPAGVSICTLSVQGNPSLCRGEMRSPERPGDQSSVAQGLLPGHNGGKPGVLPPSQHSHLWLPGQLEESLSPARVPLLMLMLVGPGFGKDFCFNCSRFLDWLPHCMLCSGNKTPSGVKLKVN